jgi:hypothetical protein
VVVWINSNGVGKMLDGFLKFARREGSIALGLQSIWWLKDQ